MPLVRCLSRSCLRLLKSRAWAFISISVKLLFIAPIIVAQAMYAPTAEPKPECKIVLLQGLHDFYNSEYASANREFGEYRSCDPTDPVAEWREGLDKLAASGFLQEGSHAKKMDVAEYQAFHLFMERGMAKAGAKIAAGDHPDFYRYVRAGLESADAVASFHSYGESWFHGRSKRLVEASEQDLEGSRYQDALYLLGLANYKTSYSLIASRFLPHDRCGGLADIQEAVRANNGIFSDDIRLAIISIAAGKKFDPAECPEYHPDVSFDRLFIRYPESRILRNYLLKVGKPGAP